MTMKRRVALFLRNKSITALLIVGLLVSFFIVINGVAMLNTIQEEQKQSEAEVYENERLFRVDENRPGQMTLEEYEKFLQMFSNMLRNLKPEQGNLMLRGHEVYVRGLLGVNADIIFTLEGELNKTIISGRLPTGEELKNREKIVLINNDIKHHIRQKNGAATIDLDGVDYKVIGIFESEERSEYKTDVILFLDTFEDEELCEMAGEWVVQVLSYSGNITEKDCDAIVETVLSYGQHIEEVQRSGRQKTKDNLWDDFNKLFIVILFVFSIINCMAISNVWINSRFRELVIRKTIGYSLFQVIGLLFVDLLKYSGVAAVLAFLFQWMTVVLFTQENMQLQYSLQTVVYLVVAMAGVIVISLIIPVIRLGFTMPAKKING